MIREDSRQRDQSPGRTTTGAEPAAGTGNKAANSGAADTEPRTGFCTKVWVHEFNADGEPDSGMVAESTNISPGGMGLRSRRMMYAGRSVLIVLDLPGMPPRVMCAVVRSSKYRENGMYETGVEFCDMPALARLRRWLQQRIAAA